LGWFSFGALLVTTYEHAIRQKTKYNITQQIEKEKKNYEGEEKGGRGVTGV
jgi:hypothetical protein